MGGFEDTPHEGQRTGVTSLLLGIPSLLAFSATRGGGPWASEVLSKTSPEFSGI